MTPTRYLAAAAGSAVASLLAADRRDRRRIAADPQHEALFTPPRGEVVTVRGAGGTPINAAVYGPEDAPVVVLAHGWTCALRFWRLQVKDLMTDHRVIAYDQRGHGSSGTPENGDWSVETMADDLEAVFEQLVPEGRPALVAGHSLGAMTIAAWAGRHDAGRRVRAAALLNTGLGDLISETLVVYTPGPLGAVREVVGNTVLGAAAPLQVRPDPLTHRAVRYVALSKTATAAQVRFSEDLVLNTKPRVRASVGREISKVELLEDLKQLTVPTLVMAGTEDKLTPPVHAERMAAVLPNCVELVKTPGGHMGPIEQAPAVNRALRALSREHLAAPVRLP